MPPQTYERFRGISRLARLTEAQICLRLLELQNRGHVWTTAMFGLTPRSVRHWRRRARPALRLARGEGVCHD
jgi:hypothetical protein